MTIVAKRGKNRPMTKRDSDLRHLKAIAERLIATRAAIAKERGVEEIGVVQFATDAGLSHNRYSQWEHAKKPPSLDGAIKLFDTYGITLPWIYLGDPDGLPHRITKHLKSELPRLTGKS